MAQIKVQVRYCDSCIKDVEASTTSRFSYNGTDYEIDLCEKHADALQRDFMSWANVGTEIERQSHFVRPEVVREHTRRPMTAPKSTAAPKSPTSAPAAEAGSSFFGTNGMAVPATAKNWMLTTHAQEQLEVRGPKYGFNREDVFACAAEPEVALQGATSDSGRWQYFRGNVQLIVDPDRKLIITVLPRSTRDFDEADQAAKYKRPAAAAFSHTEELVSAR